MSKVFIKSIGEAGIEPDDLRQAFDWLDWEQIIPHGARVFVKPNLTWPTHLPGVTTTPTAMESLAVVLKDRAGSITFGESDGGYHAYDVEEAFAGHNLYALRERYGISVVNLTDLPSETVQGEIDGKTVAVTLPSLLLHEIDVFITMPVPKTHVMTHVSLAFKNQWGCVPSPMRLREHYDFDHKIVLINKLLQPKLAVLDGTYFLDGAGPMTGDTIPMNLLIVGDDIGAASSVTCDIMGIPARSVRHFIVARKVGMFPPTPGEVLTNTPLEPFQTHQFKMKRAFLDWISLVGFRSRFFTNLFYEGFIADLLHRLLFFVRKNPLIEHFLYGKAGTPPSWHASE